MNVQTDITGLLWYWRKLKNMMILRQVLQLQGAYFFLWILSRFINVYLWWTLKIMRPLGRVSHTESKNMFIMSLCAQNRLSFDLSTFPASMSFVCDFLLFSELRYVPVSSFLTYSRLSLRASPSTLPQSENLCVTASSHLFIFSDYVELRYSSLNKIHNGFLSGIKRVQY